MQCCLQIITHTELRHTTFVPCVSFASTSSSTPSVVKHHTSKSLHLFADESSQFHHEPPWKTGSLTIFPFQNHRMHHWFFLEFSHPPEVFSFEVFSCESGGMPSALD